MGANPQTDRGNISVMVRTSRSLRTEKRFRTNAKTIRTFSTGRPLSPQEQNKRPVIRDLMSPGRNSSEGLSCGARIV